MEPTLERLNQALIKADAAGDVESAKTLAAEIRRRRGNEEAAANLVANPRPLDPTNDMNALQTFGAGWGRAVANAGRAIGQPLGMVSQKDIDEAKKIDEPLLNTMGGTIGNVLGSASLMAPLAMAPGANTILGAGLYGAGSGFALTPGTLAERGQAALESGAGGMIGNAIPAVYGAVKAAARPLTKKGQDQILADLLRKTVGDNANDVLGRLKTASPLIPGSMPTAAEVAESGGIAALQRAVQSANPEAYAQRGMEQSSARLSALRGVAGDEQKLQAAIAAREAAASPLYAAAKTQAVTRTPALDALMERPIMKQAKAKAAELARNRDEVFSLEAPTAGSPAIVDSMGLPLRAAEAATPGTYSANGLHYLKLALDDLGSGEAKTAMGRNELAALSDSRQRLLQLLDDSVPDYKAARAAFAQGSEPINQMQVGQELLNKVQPALAQHGALARETGNQYATALNDVRGNLVKNATGGIKRSLEDVMTPDQMDTLNAVAQDLARKANAQELGRGVGSNTFQNFAMNNLAAESGVPSAVSGALQHLPVIGQGIGAIKALGNVIYKTKDEAMRARLAQMLLDPQETAGILNLSMQTPGKWKQLLSNPQMQAIPGILGASLPAAQ